MFIVWHKINYSNILDNIQLVLIIILVLLFVTLKLFHIYLWPIIRKKEISTSFCCLIARSDEHLAVGARLWSRKQRTFLWLLSMTEIKALTWFAVWQSSMQYGMRQHPRQPTNKQQSKAFVCVVEFGSYCTAELIITLQCGQIILCDILLIFGAWTKTVAAGMLEITKDHLINHCKRQQ